MEAQKVTVSTAPRKRTVEHVMNVILAGAGIAAVAALVLEYGFRSEVVPRAALRVGQGAIVAVFVADRLIRLVLAPHKGRYLRENFVDFALMAIAAGVLAINFRTVLSAGALYVFITQAYLLIVLVMRGVSLNLRFAGSGIHPSWLLIGSFLFMIAVGSGLLMLPVAVKAEFYDSWYYDNALFTATSATCVTGLVVVNTGGHFTPFGQGVILALIQCGGLGIMLFGTVLGLLIGKGLTVKQSQTIGQMLSSDGIGRLVRIAVFVIAITFALELIGAVGLYGMFSEATDTYGRELSRPGAVWHGVFHSISSFCNAGFALYDKNMMHGLGEQSATVALRGRWQIMGVMAPLIVLGGLGFPVLSNCAKWGVGVLRRMVWKVREGGSVLPNIPAPARLSLHSKVVLSTSLVLILSGAGILLLIEPSPDSQERIGRHRLKAPAPSGGDWTEMPLSRRAREAAFQSITARTAGFNTIDIAELSQGGKLWMCILMIIGGSPASTAGGMKTVTFALLILGAVTQLRRRREFEAFRRSIPLVIVERAFAIAVLYLSLVVTITILLCIAQGPGYRFIDLLVEACSACGTVGLSTGVTRSLSLFGKLVIIIGMFAGRLGPLTLLAGITARLRHVDYTYPEENVIIG